MGTQLIRSLHHAKPAHQAGVITIGNFDGVHLGHQHLVQRVIEKAAQLPGPSIAVTFEPHPFEFFGEGNIPRLTTFREKFCALRDCGLDYVLLLPFNQKLAELSATDFITQLWTALHPKHIIVGEDFRFGHRRHGDVNLLKNIGEQLQFNVEAMADFKIGGERVSSTRVRQALVAGDHELVERLLGHPYTLMGKVMRGDQRGRQWGFPTANIFLHGRVVPIRGVYLVIVSGVGSKPVSGVANIGLRPTVDGTRCLLEVHLLDFDRDIYGSNIKVSFLKKLRDENRFANVELLKKQIADDVKEARKFFATET